MKNTFNFIHYSITLEDGSVMTCPQDFEIMDKCAKRNNLSEKEARELIDNVRKEI